MSWPLSSPTERSITITRRGTPIWGAARPMPGAPYMVATMSSTRETTWPSMFLTGAEGACSTGVPYFRISRIGMCLRWRRLGAFADAPGQHRAVAGPGRFQVVQELPQRVAAQLLQHRVRQHPGHHGLAHHPRGGHHAGVAALHRSGLGL